MLDPIAWAAGFIDGEGCIRLCRPRRGFGYHCAPVISVTNTNLPALELLKQLFGGTIHWHDKSRPKWTWVWRLQAKKNVYPCLERLLPHLLVKRAEAELLLSSRQYMRGSGNYLTAEERRKLDWLREQLSTLKHSPSAVQDTDYADVKEREN